MKRLEVKTELLPNQEGVLFIDGDVWHFDANHEYELDRLNTEFAVVSIKYSRDCEDSVKIDIILKVSEIVVEVTGSSTKDLMLECCVCETRSRRVWFRKRISDETQSFVVEMSLKATPVVKHVFTGKQFSWVCANPEPMPVYNDGVLFGSETLSDLQNFTELNSAEWEEMYTNISQLKYYDVETLRSLNEEARAFVLLHFARAGFTMFARAVDDGVCAYESYMHAYKIWNLRRSYVMQGAKL